MQTEQINSIKDERIQFARSLSAQKNRLQSGHCLLEGEQAVLWALSAGRSVKQVFVTGNTGKQFLTHLADKTTEILLVSQGVMRKITGRNYEINAAGVYQWQQQAGKIDADLSLVLDGLQDQGNIGTILRTCSAFNVNSIRVPETLDLWHRKTIDASRGRVFSGQFSLYRKDEELVAKIKQRGDFLITTSPHAPVLQSEIRLPHKPVVLVVGNETEGASEVFMREADLCVQIPMSGMVESLNVGVSTGISLYEIKFKQVLAMLTNLIRKTLGRELNVSGKMLQYDLDQRLKETTGFSALQVIFMMVLQCDREMSRKQAGRDTGLYNADLEHFLQPLFEQGLIVKVESGIAITENGEEKISRLWSFVEQSENRALEGFSQTEKEQLFGFLKRIQQNLA